MPQLRFYARRDALVADVHAQEHPTHPVRRYIGRRWQEVNPGQWGWAATEEGQTVEYHHDLARACRDGDLWPADAETARICGAPFDPTFGNEETETIKAWRARVTSQTSAPAGGDTPSQSPQPGAGTSDDTNAPRRSKGEVGKGER